MRFGYFCTPFFAADRPPGATAERVLENVQTAQSLGFDYVELGDHHVTPEGRFLQNVPTAGRLSAKFDHVGLTLLLPLYDPLFVAEYLGTLGAFVDQVDVWPVVGGDERAFDALDVPMSERGPRFLESIELVKRLLAEESVTFEGDFYSVADVTVEPRTDVRWCIGGLAEPAVRRAGRIGDAWAVHPSESPADIERKLEWFQEEGGGDVVVRRDALVRENGDEARETMTEMLESGYRGWPPDQDWMVVGSPADAADDIEALEAIGADELVFGVAGDQDCAEETLRGLADARERVYGERPERDRS